MSDFSPQLLQWRGLIFLGLFGLFAALEVWVPYRKRLHGRQSRWPGNLAMVGVFQVLLRLLVPAGLVGVSLLTADRGWGVFHWLGMSGSLLEMTLSVLIFDGLIYLQHLISHRVPLLWRLHKVHHADGDLDVSSALRFHPIEMALSFAYKACWVIFWGSSATAVVLFEIVLSSMAIFNHANLFLPPSLERRLRWLVVTPQMHIIHHSLDAAEQNRNFGFNFSFWDRLFGTYGQKFKGEGHIGLREGNQHRLWGMLRQPFATVSQRPDNKTPLTR